MIWALLALSMVAALCGHLLYRQGAQSMRESQKTRALEVKDEQLKKTLNTPRSRDTLLKWLRDGRF
jgi:hypothetical protein